MQNEASVTESAGDVATLIRRVPGVRVWRHAPLAPFTTIGCGGKAGVLVTCDEPRAVCRVLELVRLSGGAFEFLGSGSNLLVADQGYAGVVIKLADSFQYVPHPEGETFSDACKDPGGAEISPTGDGMSVVLEAGGALSLPRLAVYAAENGLSGLEFACGIPGSVGGATLMNAGAHGGQLSDLLLSVQVASADGLEWVSAGRICFGYRCSGLPAGACVTAVRLVLTASDTQEVLAAHRANLKKRRLSQPRGARTFGSAFKNPSGDAAGRLLDQAGVKGMSRGGACVSSVHANFVVNTGDATTADVLHLMTMMRETVQRVHGVVLEPEVKVWGTDFPWRQESGHEG